MKWAPEIGVDYPGTRDKNEMKKLIIRFPFQKIINPVFNFVIIKQPLYGHSHFILIPRKF